MFTGLPDLGVDPDVAVEECEEGEDARHEQLLPHVAHHDVGRVLHDARRLVVVALEKRKRPSPSFISLANRRS